MTRVLVAPWLFSGHSVPHLGLAQGLLEQGHEVFFYGERSTAASARQAGCIPITMPTANAETIYPKCDSLPEIKRILLALAQRVAPHLLAVLRRKKIDLVVTDLMHLGGALAAQRSGLPWASLAIFPTAPFPRPGFGPAVFADLPTATLRRRLGLPATDADSMRQSLSPHLLLLPWTAEFDVGRLPRQAVHVGPLNWDAPSQTAPPWIRRLDQGAPVVLAAMSTLVVDRVKPFGDRYVAAAIDAMRNLPIRGIVTVGGDMDVRRFPKPRNVRIQPFVPHSLLMPKLSAVVTHGGWGMVGRALTQGVPMMVVPFGLDQPMNGHLCQANGVGFSEPVTQITAEILHDRLSQLLPARSKQRRRVGTFARKIARLRPQELAAKLVLSLSR